MNKTLASITALAGAFTLGLLAMSFGNARNIAVQDSVDTDSGRQAPLSASRAPQFIDPSPIQLDTGFSDEQIQDIREIVRATLVDNPQILMEAINVHQNREQLAEEAQARAGASANLTALLDDKNGYVSVADNNKAKVAVIELFDYHCGHCKRASGLVRDLARTDEEVLVAFREFPILREESEIAAEAALAARNQGKYIDLHFALMNANGVLTKARILDIAKTQKLDVKALEADMQSAEVGVAIRDTIRIAQEMGVNGTPAFIVASLDGEYLDVISGFNADAVMRSVAAAKQ